MAKKSSPKDGLYNPPLILEVLKDIHEDGKIIYKKGQTLYAFKKLEAGDDPLSAILADQSLIVTDQKDGSGEQTFIPKDKVKKIGTLGKR